MSTAVTPATVLELLREGVERLTAAGLPTSRQDAEWLLASLLGLERFGLYVEPRRPVEAATGERYRQLLARRERHEPLQYLLGFEDFHGLRLRVTPDVLIPRPETEGLVAWALEHLIESPQARVADVGTGSGAIACALAVAAPGIRVWGIDSSPAALAVAAANVRALGLAARVRLVAGDCLAGLGSSPGGVDHVVANPPYLPSGLIERLPEEVARFEPREALDGGPDGLRVIRRLVEQAAIALRPGGWLLMEIGEEQAGAVASLMAAEGFERLASRTDLRGVERYIAGRLPGGAPLPDGPRGVCG